MWNRDKTVKRGNPEGEMGRTVEKGNCRSVFVKKRIGEEAFGVEEGRKAEGEKGNERRGKTRAQSLKKTKGPLYKQRGQRTAASILQKRREEKRSKEGGKNPKAKI